MSETAQPASTARSPQAKDWARPCQARSYAVKKGIKQEITGLLENLIQADFPTLRSYELSVIVDRSCDYVTAVSIKRRNVTVWIDKTDIRKMNARARIGALVHELCHVERDLKKSPVRCFAEATLSLALPSIVTRDERMTDELVIAKGYGKELLAFQKYHDRHYEPYNEQDGLTCKEIRARITNRNSDASNLKS